MKLVLASALLALAFTEARAAPPTAALLAPPAPIVFFDVAGPDMGKLEQFYASNVGWATDARTE